MVSFRSRILLIDLLKASAAQFIVLHHLAWFGPLSINAAELGPVFADTIAWFANYGRYAVAVFFVTGGFLAGLSLPHSGLQAAGAPLCLIRERYFRLVLPFMVALLIAALCNIVARPWLPPDLAGHMPTILQFLAHLLMLQGFLDVESLSAGVWYVAIDFQLYALFVLLLWSSKIWGHRPASTDFYGAVPVLLIALASLFYFNRDARWDDTAFYFFGVYALGIGSGWAVQMEKSSRMLWLIATAGGVALLIDFRPRIVIALITALVLGCSRLHMKSLEMRVLHYFGSTSYALFLIHFPVFMLVTAFFQHILPDNPGMGAFGLLFAWLVSILAADVFHRGVEVPFARWRKRQIQCSTRQNPVAGNKVSSVSTINKPCNTA
jgi:peptidoglycan/LPS O-acetylase OafA/YrhL